MLTCISSLRLCSSRQLTSDCLRYCRATTRHCHRNRRSSYSADINRNLDPSQHHLGLPHRRRPVLWHLDSHRFRGSRSLVDRCRSSSSCHWWCRPLCPDWSRCRYCRCSCPSLSLGYVYEVLRRGCTDLIRNIERSKRVWRNGNEHQTHKHTNTIHDRTLRIDDSKLRRYPRIPNPTHMCTKPKQQPNFNLFHFSKPIPHLHTQSRSEELSPKQARHAFSQ